MDCIGCSIQNICKVADSIKEAALIAQVNISNCRIKAQLSANATTVIPSANPAPMAPVAPGPMMPKVMRDFKDISNAIRQKDKDHTEKVDKVKIIEDSGEPVYVTCLSCGGKTTSDDVALCTDCGKQICSNCGTEDGGTKSKYCEPCWSKK